MPPVRTSISAVKPMKTERTHEENQERAYIAASRRSDRSLEARIESARRASEIHKRRTGRSLRVTEQDVVNEEMYEEEDDDLPMQYQRLSAHLRTESHDFNRRVMAWYATQQAMRDAVGRGNGPFTPGGQFMNPSFIQMQQPPMQASMMLPQMYNNTPANYRSAPYPVMQNNTTQANVRPNMLSRSTSIATPPGPPQFAAPTPQHSQSVQVSPVEVKHPSMDEQRRMSLPVQSAGLPQTPLSHQGLVQSPTRVSPVLSRNGSSTNLTTPNAPLKGEQPPQQVPTPPEPVSSYRPTATRTNSQTTPSFNHVAFDQQALNDSIAPFTTELPLEAKQLFADITPMDYSAHFPSLSQQPPAYSYNPNGSKATKAHLSPPNYGGLNQTLMAPPLDASVAGGANMDPPSMFAPSSGLQNADPVFYTPQSSAYMPSFGGKGMTGADGPAAFSYDALHTPAFDPAAFDLFPGMGTGLSTSHSAQTMSGTVTPQEGTLFDFLEFGASQEDLNGTAAPGTAAA